MDLARLNRALEALECEAVWLRWHNPQEKKRVPDGEKVNELYRLLPDELFEKILGRKRKRKDSG